jgi:N-acetylglutamate synthase-like GNAT family acetyltransferase
MRQRLTIRAATVGDVPTLAQLLGVLGYPSQEAAVRASLEAMFQDRRHAVAVAELAGEAVGLLALTVRPSLNLGGWVGVLESLVVRSDRRGRGVGEALLQFAKGLAVERGVVRLEAPVTDMHTAAAEPFLLALGFEPGGTRAFRWSVLEAKHPRVPTVERGPVPAFS